MTTIPSFDLEEPVDFPNLPGVAAPDYADWCSRGAALAQEHSNRQWAIGGWLIEGEEHFDGNALLDGVPGYMRLRHTTDENGEAAHKNTQIVNFWKDAGEITGMAQSTLAQYAQVSRAYPAEQRFAVLTWSHHAVVCSYARRLEYLKAALPVDGGRAKSVAWLAKYAEEQEGVPVEEIQSQFFVRVPMPEEIWTKLKELGKYYGIPVNDLMAKAVVKAAREYVDAEAKKLSLRILEFYEPGVWPFDKIRTRRQRRKASGRTRRRARQTSPDFRQSRHVGALQSWRNRRERLDMKPVTIRVIDRR